MNSFIIGRAHFNFRKMPAELDEFIYMQPNGMITRNTRISIIEYRIRGNQISAISSPFQSEYVKACHFSVSHFSE
jgi:hypothetical protein